MNDNLMTRDQYMSKIPSYFQFLPISTYLQFPYFFLLFQHVSSFLSHFHTIRHFPYLSVYRILSISMSILQQACPGCPIFPIYFLYFVSDANSYIPFSVFCPTLFLTSRFLRLSYTGFPFSISHLLLIKHIFC